MQIPDLTGVKTSTGNAPLCPVGWHAMKVKDVSVNTNAKGNTSHGIVFSCIEGGIEGSEARDNFTIASTSGANTKVGRERYKGLLTCLGFNGFAGLDTNMLIGRACRVLVEHGTFPSRDTGKPINSAKVRAYEPLKAGSSQPGAGTDAAKPAMPAIADEAKLPF